MPFSASAILELLTLPLDFVHLAVRQKQRENVKNKDLEVAYFIFIHVVLVESVIWPYLTAKEAEQYFLSTCMEKKKKDLPQVTRQDDQGELFTLIRNTECSSFRYMIGEESKLRIDGGFIFKLLILRCL